MSDIKYLPSAASVVASFMPEATNDPGKRISEWLACTNLGEVHDVLQILLEGMHTRPGRYFQATWLLLTNDALTRDFVFSSGGAVMLARLPRAGVAIAIAKQLYYYCWEYAKGLADAEVAATIEAYDIPWIT